MYSRLIPIDEHTEAAAISHARSDRLDQPVDCVPDIAGGSDDGGYSAFARWRPTTSLIGLVHSEVAVEHGAYAGRFATNTTDPSPASAGFPV